MTTTRAEMPLPPPPPPPLEARSVPSEQEDQHFAFTALKQLGYPVDQLSPWKLVTELLNDVMQGRETLQNERHEFERVLDEERKKTEKAERDKLNVLKEVARKIQESEEEKREERRVELLQDALFEKGDASSRALSEMVVKNKKLNAELERVRTALAECQTECQRLASVASYASSGKDSAFTELEQQQQARTETAKWIARLNQMIEEEKAAKQSLADELDHVRIEFIKLEGERDGLRHKLERANASIATQQEAKKKVEEVLEKAREETKATSELLMEERRSRKTLKVKLEEVEKDLKQARDDMEKQEKKYLTLEKTKIDLEQQSGVLKRQIGAQGEALSTRDEELRQALAKLDTVEQSLEDERKQHNLRLHEVRAAALDVSNMARENRDLTHALEKMQRDIRETKANLEESRAKNQRFAGMLDAAKLERAELLSVYSKVCDESARLNEELKATTATKAELLKEERTASDTAAELTRKLAELDLLAKRQRIDLENYDRKVEGLTRELKVYKSKCEALEESKTLAEKAQGSEQQRYAQAARQHEALRWELEQTKTEFANCASRLEKALEENTKLAEQLVGERLRVEEMEAQVERARIGQAKALISSGQAFTSATERLRTPFPERTPSTANQRQVQTSRATAASGQPQQQAASERESPEDDLLSSSLSTMKDFDERFEELERVMGEDLSEASSVIRQTREDRRRTPGFSARQPQGPPSSGAQ